MSPAHVNQTTILNIGSSKYLVDPQPIEPVISLEFPKSPESLGIAQPVTLISLNGIQSVSRSIVQELLDELLASDDVLSLDFAKNTILQIPTHSPSPSLQSQVLSLLRGHDEFASLKGDLPPGPYVLLNSRLHKVFKLYPDTYGAFMYGVLPAGDDSSRYSRAPTTSIPIPSRHYFPPPSPTTPLSGKRIAVKDIYALSGLPTSSGSKSYEALYPAVSETAECIQKLIDLGAVIVGKTKTVQLASGMGARDWIEFQCPFNPRGDGYLDPDCSSSGSAAAIAAYGWLDCAVGSDSLGSMVGPASACGVYGLRPTQDSISNKGALANSALLDTPGHFSRDISSFGGIASSWLDIPDKKYAFNPPARILFPAERFAPYVNAKLEVMESFIKDLEIATKTPRTVFDMDTLWKENAPEGIEEKSIDEYISTTLAHIQLHDSYHSNSTFRSDYQTKFNSVPYVEPLIKYKWDLGSKLTEAEYRQACTEKAIFKKFLQDQVFTPGTIMVLPGGDSDLSYRDGYPGTLEETGKNWQGFGFTNTAFSVLGGGPSLSIPVGERKYVSKITGNEAFQPVSLWVLGAIGTDIQLIDLVKNTLQKRQRPLSVGVGSRAF